MYFKSFLSVVVVVADFCFARLCREHCNQRIVWLCKNRQPQQLMMADDWLQQSDVCLCILLPIKFYALVWLDKRTTLMYTHECVLPVTILNCIEMLVTRLFNVLKIKNENKTTNSNKCARSEDTK